MTNIIAIILILFILVGCQQKTSSIIDESKPPVAISKAVVGLSESEQLNTWFDIKHEEWIQMSPMDLTDLGRKEKYDQIDNMTESEDRRQLDWRAASVDEMKNNFDYKKLNSDAKISYDLWLYLHKRDLEAQKYQKNRYFFIQRRGPQTYFVKFLTRKHRVDNESDMQAYNKRIIGIANAIDQLLQRTKINAKHSVRPPRPTYDAVIKQAEKIITGRPFSTDEIDSPIWSDANKKINALLDNHLIDKTSAVKLRNNTKQFLLSHLGPSYLNLINWLKEDRSQTNEFAKGVGSHPNGEEFYDFRLKRYTTTNLSSDEIHQIGLDEVARLSKEMRKLKDETDFRGNLQEFFIYLRNDQQFFYPNTDKGRLQYIADTKVSLDVMEDKLPQYFNLLPKTKLEVKRIQSYREYDGGIAYYQPGEQKGIYYLHLLNMKTMPKMDMQALAYHEGLPGHHLQKSIAKALSGIPKFRTQVGFTAYTEGWGLYAEQLAKEMGAYQNIYSDFGRLTFEMWRAVRLVVDTGIHSKGWPEEKAVSYFKHNTSLPDKLIKEEILRYFYRPGQATSYKIGMLKILELRALAKKELGNKFRLADFHDVILGGGAMPLTILERRVKEWLANTKLLKRPLET